MAGGDSDFKKRVRQHRYWARQKAAVDGHDKVKALNRQRYRARIERMKASGQYEAFKAKKAVEGLKRYRDMTEEAREERKRKNLLCQRLRKRLLGPAQCPSEGSGRSQTTGHEPRGLPSITA